ncbi:hypothetical protein H671_2g4652 [Cricetulus griseus]|nr:hypothetical protein H671_2g4652 [Cricetulus griseus]
MREQKVRVEGRIEESKKGNTIIEGDNLGLQRNQALGKVFHWRLLPLTLYSTSSTIFIFILSVRCYVPISISDFDN